MCLGPCEVMSPTSLRNFSPICQEGCRDFYELEVGSLAFPVVWPTQENFWLPPKGMQSTRCGMRSWEAASEVICSGCSNRCNFRLELGTAVLHMEQGHVLFSACVCCPTAGDQHCPAALVGRMVWLGVPAHSSAGREGLSDKGRLLCCKSPVIFLYHPTLPRWAPKKCLRRVFQIPQAHRKTTWMYVFVGSLWVLMWADINLISPPFTSYRRQIAPPGPCPAPEQVTLKKKAENVKSRHLCQGLPALAQY